MIPKYERIANIPQQMQGDIVTPDFWQHLGLWLALAAIMAAIIIWEVRK